MLQLRKFFSLRTMMKIELFEVQKMHPALLIAIFMSRLGMYFAVILKGIKEI